MSEDRTIYTVVDETGTKTTITLDKWVADILQEHFPDVHAWVQDTYDRVATKKPHLGRRQKGDVVRVLSINEVLKTPAGIALMSEL